MFIIRNLKGAVMTALFIKKDEQLIEIQLKGSHNGILSYFDHRQNYLEIEGNLKIILCKDGKAPKR